MDKHNDEETSCGAGDTCDSALKEATLSFSVGKQARDLTSNVEIGRCGVARAGAVHGDTLVLPLVHLLTVLNLQRACGGAVHQVSMRVTGGS